MKKYPRKIEWAKMAAAIGGLLLLAAVFCIASATLGSYGDSGQTELPVLNREQKVSLITSGKTVWQYLDERQETVEESGNQKKWRENKYDFSGWKEASGSFGAKDGERRDMGEGTAPNNLLVQYGSDGSSSPVYLFRTELTIANPESIKTLKGMIEFDDAVLIYINGELVWTGNVPEGGYGSLLDYGAKEGVNSPRDEEFIIEDTSMLKTGRNTVAVELHQNYSSGSDIFFNFLSLEGLAKESETKQLETSGLILEVGENENRVRVNWYTDEKGAFELRYSLKQNEEEPAAYATSLMGRQNGATKGVYCYTAELASLEAGKEYVYKIQRIASDDQSVSYTYSAAGMKEQFTFLFAGDPQIGAEETGEDSIKWEEALKKSLELVPDASFLISAGDQVDSGDEKKAKQQYFGFRSPDILKRLPVAVNRGNHEAKNNLYDKQFQREGTEEMEYSFVFKDVLFIALDSMADSLEQQTDFLRSAVKKYPARWTVVTMHYSLFSAGSHADDEGIIRRREYFAPIFSELGIDLVLAGHDHSYTRTFYMNGLNSSGKTEGKKQQGEVLYLTGGSSTGNKFYKKTKADVGYVAFFLEEKAAVMTAVTVQETSLEIRTFDTSTGTVIDSCMISK